MAAGDDCSPGTRRKSLLSNLEDLGLVDYFMKKNRHGCSECIYLNPASRKGQKAHFYQMLFLPLIPIAALIIQNCFSISLIMNSLQEAQIIHQQV